MSTTSTQIALYCQGTFDIANPTEQQQAVMLADADEIAAAGFTTVLLGQWHAKVDENGDFNIYFNDTPYGADTAWALNNIPNRLLNGGVQYVPMTFGPFGSDFNAITDNLDAFKQIVGDIFQNTYIGGLDFDIEQDYSDANQQTLAHLADWVVEQRSAPGVSQSLVVTASPYTNVTWWAQLLTLTSNFDWFNIQAAFFNGYQGWLTDLPCEASFLLYGFNVSTNLGEEGASTLAQAQVQLEDIKQHYPEMGGTIFWNYEGMKPQRWEKMAAKALGVTS